MSRTERLSSQRGLLTTELAIIFPIVIVLALGIVQLALWSHAGAVAQAAADHGAEVAAAFGSDDAQGQSAAIDFANNAGSIGNVQVSASNAPDSEFVTVTITGTYASVFGSLSISATATTVRERVTP